MVGLAALVTTAFLVVPVIVTLALAAAGHLTLDLRPDPATGDGSAARQRGHLAGRATWARSSGSSRRSCSTACSCRSSPRRSSVDVPASARRGRATRGRMLPLVGLTLPRHAARGPLLIGVPVAARGARRRRRPGSAIGLRRRHPAVPRGAVAVGLFVQVRFFQLAAPALVLERTGVFASLRRAGRLSRGQFWRLFGILLLTGAGRRRRRPGRGGAAGAVGALGPTVFPGTAGALLLVLSSFLSQILVGAHHHTVHLRGHRAAVRRPADPQGGARRASSSRPRRRAPRAPLSMLPSTVAGPRGRPRPTRTRPGPGWSASWPAGVPAAACSSGSCPGSPTSGTD